MFRDTTIKKTTEVVSRLHQLFQPMCCEPVQPLRLFLHCIKPPEQRLAKLKTIFVRQSCRLWYICTKQHFWIFDAHVNSQEYQGLFQLPIPTSGQNTITSSCCNLSIAPCTMPVFAYPRLCESQFKELLSKPSVHYCQQDLSKIHTHALFSHLKKIV